MVASDGKCTIYGDMCGGLAVISDLPKTRVFEVARWLNRNGEVIPWNTIEKPPSASCKPRAGGSPTATARHPLLPERRETGQPAARGTHFLQSHTAGPPAQNVGHLP